jgi:hypothetical protein
VNGPPNDETAQVKAQVARDEQIIEELRTDLSARKVHDAESVDDEEVVEKNAEKKYDVLRAKLEKTIRLKKYYKSEIAKAKADAAHEISNLLARVNKTQFELADERRVSANASRVVALARAAEARAEMENAGRERSLR